MTTHRLYQDPAEYPRTEEMTGLLQRRGASLGGALAALAIKDEFARPASLSKTGSPRWKTSSRLREDRRLRHRRCSVDGRVSYVRTVQIPIRFAQKPKYIPAVTWR